MNSNLFSTFTTGTVAVALLTLAAATARAEIADLEKAVDGAMLAKFRNTGQSCIAANRIYVQCGIYDRFLNRFVEKTRAHKVGDVFEPGV